MTAYFDTHSSAALRRSPTQLAKLIKKDCKTTAGLSILDYGCGRSIDTSYYVTDCDMSADKFDPYYAPVLPNTQFDIVAMSHVLDVIADKIDRVILIQSALKILKPEGSLYVMTNSQSAALKLAQKNNLESYNDGFSDSNTDIFYGGFSFNSLCDLIVPWNSISDLVQITSDKSTVCLKVIK